jgi:hypothetical protein
MKISSNMMIAIFLFGSVIIGILINKLQGNNKTENRVIFRERPNYIFYDDLPYRYPRRSIDINLRGVNIPTPPTTTTPTTTTPTTLPITTAHDTSDDEAIARDLARDLGGEFGTRDFRVASASGGGGADGSGGPAIVGGIYRGRRGRREGFTNNIEPYMNSPSTLTGSPY